MDAGKRARACVDDYLGEGVIAFPELPEMLVHYGVPGNEAVSASVAILGEYLAAGRITLHRGRASDEDFPEVVGDEAKRLIGQHSAYRYGEGDEVRAWFVVPA